MELANACRDLGTLSGFTVAITADRRRDEQAELLRAMGATVIEATVMRTLPLTADDRLHEVTESLIASPPDMLIAATGIGVRGWLAAAQAWGLEERLLTSLHATEIVVRGPKVRSALQQVSLDVAYEEPSERLAALVEHVARDIQPGAHVALLLSGREARWAVDELTAAGAQVIPVRVYHWTGAEDGEPVRRLITAVLEDRVDAVTFTSGPAVEHFLTAAADDAPAVIAQFNCGIVAGCVGPVTADVCRAAGIEDPCAPAHGRLGHMVRALADRLAKNHRHLVVGDHHFIAQGRCLHAGGTTVQLTAREHALFDVLTRHPGAVVSRETLLRQVWRSSDDAVLDKTMSRLRRRLAPTGIGIDTVSRRGYVVWGTEVPCASVL